MYLEGFNFVSVASALAGASGVPCRDHPPNSAAEKTRPTPLKEIPLLLCPEHAADALRQTPDILYQSWSLSCCGGNKPEGILVQQNPELLIAD